MRGHSPTRIKITSTAFRLMLILLSSLMGMSIDMTDVRALTVISHKTPYVHPPVYHQHSSETKSTAHLTLSKQQVKPQPIHQPIIGKTARLPPKSVRPPPPPQRDDHNHKDIVDKLKVTVKVPPKGPRSNNKIYDLTILTSFVDNFSPKNYTFCPVSASKDTVTASTHHIYPTDIFFDNTGTPLKDLKTHECFEFDLYGGDHTTKINHTCPDEMQFCPIKHQNVMLATKDLSWWDAGFSFCDLPERLKEKEPIYVYVLGNSVTIGTGCNGCRLDHTADWRQTTDPFYHEKSKLCAWPNYLGSWLKTLSNTSVVQTRNLAISGYTTLTTGQMIDTVLQNVSKFTSRDIIFLDHSLTDPQHFKHDKSTTTMEKSLQFLINQLHAHSLPGQIPAIILIETDTITDNFAALLTTAYTNIAIVNGLQYISYRNAIYSDPALGTLPYRGYLKFYHQNRADFHPSWYIHLYIADLIAAVMLNEVSECISNQHKGLKIITATIHPNVSIAASSNESLDPDMLTCDANVSPLLRMSYDAIARNHTLIGRFATPHNYWNVTTDMRGRGGFIRSVSHNDIYATHDNATIVFYFNTSDNKAWNNNNAGIVQTSVNTGSDIGASSNIGNNAIQASQVKQRNRYLRRLDTTSHNINAINNAATRRTTASGTFMLSITYLSSYVHVGVVDVYICNQYMTTIDALWDDHHSLPQVKNILINRTHCSNIQNIALESTDNSGLFAVEIKHRIQLSTNNTTISSSGSSNATSHINFHHLVETAPRYKQMFKIVSVQLCQV